MFLSTTKSLLVDTYKNWSFDKAPKLAAALAYYTVFSIAPLLMLVIGIASLAFGEEAARGQIMGQLSSVVGASAASTVQEALENLHREQHGGIATLIGAITLLLGATGVFSELQDSLNRIWEVRPKPTEGIWGYIRRRFISLGMVLVIGFLLLVSLVLTTSLSAMIKYFSGILPGADILWQIATVTVSLILISALFAAMFKILPDVKIRWRDVWIGASLTAVLFTIGKTLIGLYLGQSTMASSFGAAGSLVLLLIWVYYSAQIFFFGAEFTKVYANRFGTRIVPSENAEPAPNALGQETSQQAKARSAG